MKISRREIKLPDNPTTDELKAAAAQARQFAEELRGKATMWDNYAASLERSADRRALVDSPPK